MSIDWIETKKIYILCSFESCRTTFSDYLWRFHWMLQLSLIFHSINYYRGHRKSPNDKNEHSRSKTIRLWSATTTNLNLLNNMMSIQAHTYTVFFSYSLFLVNQYDEWNKGLKLRIQAKHNGKRTKWQWEKEIKNKMSEWIKRIIQFKRGFFFRS